MNACNRAIDVLTGTVRNQFLPDRSGLFSAGKHTLHHETSRRHDQCRHPHFTGKSTSLLANARFLNRAQRTQRGLLCFG
jgi:hypothetical protein